MHGRHSPGHGPDVVAESSPRQPGRARRVLLATCAGALVAGVLAVACAASAWGHAGLDAGRTLALSESQTVQGITHTCTSNGFTTHGCSSVDQFAGQRLLLPGDTVSSRITLANTGTADARALTMTPRSCSRPSAGDADLCDRVEVQVREFRRGGSTDVTARPVPLAAFGRGCGYSLGALPAGASVTVEFTVVVPADLAPADGGQRARQRIVWTLDGPAGATCHG